MEFIILFLLIGVSSIVVNRRWQTRATQVATKQTVDAQTAITNATNANLATRITDGWRQRMPWGSQPTNEQQKLRMWLTTALVDSAAEPREVWLAMLTDAEFNALRDQLDGFCTAVNIDLTWLVEQKLAQEPELAQAIRGIVINYVRAQRQASLIQPDLKAFKTYQTLTTYPYSREHQPLILQLYSQLVKEGLTSPVKPEALLATEKIRQTQTMQAIQAAVAADRKAFYRILKALISESPLKAST